MSWAFKQHISNNVEYIDARDRDPGLGDARGTNIGERQRSQTNLQASNKLAKGNL
jgi:hypothetical protein